MPIEYPVSMSDWWVSDDESSLSLYLEPFLHTDVNEMEYTDLTMNTFIIPSDSVPFVNTGIVVGVDGLISHGPHNQQSVFWQRQECPRVWTVSLSQSNPQRVVRGNLVSWQCSQKYVTRYKVTRRPYLDLWLKKTTTDGFFFLMDMIPGNSDGSRRTCVDLTPGQTP